MLKAIPRLIPIKKAKIVFFFCQRRTKLSINKTVNMGMKLCCQSIKDLTTSWGEVAVKMPIINASLLPPIKFPKYINIPTVNTLRSAIVIHGALIAKGKTIKDAIINQ